MSEIVVQHMSEREARKHIEIIKHSADDIVQAAIALCQGQAWLAFGYVDWFDLCEHELAHATVRRDAIDWAIAEMTEAGMTDRQIAPVVQLHHATVSRKQPKNVANATAGRPPKMDPAKRDEIILRMLDEGAKQQPIADAIGYSRSRTQTFIAELGRAAGDRPKALPAADPTILPARKPSERRPSAATGRRHRRPGNLLDVIGDVQRRFDEDRWALRACHQVDDAEADDDGAWLRSLRNSAERLRADLLRIVQVIDDDTFRNAQSRQGDGRAPNVTTQLRSMP